MTRMTCDQFIASTLVRRRSVAWISLVLALTALSCGATSDPGTDTSTNWLKPCDTDAECGLGTSCECGVCTTTCETEDDCTGLSASAVCRDAASSCERDSRLCLASADEPGNGSDSSEVWSARPSWSVFDSDRRGRALTIGEDGSIYVTGGQGRTPADLSVAFENFWLARFSAEGTPLWEQIEVSENDGQWPGLAVALSPDGVLTTVLRSRIVQRHDIDGMPLGEYSVEPEVRLLATAPSGQLIAAGSNLIERRGGRPFMELWVGELSNEGVAWQQTLRGSDGSISTAWDLAVTESGYFVAGSRGNAADSNASDAWVGAAAYMSDFDWGVVTVPGGGNGRSISVAVTPDGGAVVVGAGETPFVHRYGPGGSSEWARTLDDRPTTVAATEQGYAVGYDANTAVGNPDPTVGRIDFFDWDGELLWRFSDPSCEAVQDLVEHEGALVALIDCNSGLGLFHIPIDQMGSGLGGLDLGNEALRTCASAGDCEPGHSCQSETCAQDCTSTQQCPADYRCVLEHTDEGQCPFLGPGENDPGVCLPRCFSQDACGLVAPGMTCWNGSCVLELPECERRCLRTFNGCEEGCLEIRGRGVNPAQGCIAPEEQLLGCYPEGRGSTADDGCVKSPDGVIYSGGGFYGATLILNFGFSECSDEDQQLWSNAVSCAD